MIDEETLRHLPARSPRSILDRLAGASKAGPFHVILHLRSGQSLEGRFVKLEDDRGLQVLLCTGPRGEDLAYVPLDAVLALGLREAALHREALSFGSLRMSSGPVPGRLELARALRAHTATLAETRGLSLALEAALDELPAGDTPLFAIRELALALVAALAEASADDFGKAALAHLRRVRLVHQDGATLVFSRAGDALLLAQDLNLSLGDRLPARLAEALNAAL